jgi:hypothetical protein
MWGEWHARQKTPGLFLRTPLSHRFLRECDMRKRQADQRNRRTITFRIPAHLMDGLRELARQKGHTLSREAGLAIKARLSESRPKQ